MLSRSPDLTVRRRGGSTLTTRVLSSSSLRTPKDARLIPFGMAENADVGGELTVAD